MLMLFAIGTAGGQSDDRGWQWSAPQYGVQGYYGMIIPHAEGIRDLAGSNPQIIELTLMRYFTRERAWSYFGAYPAAGMALHLVDFGNREQIGRSVAFYPFVEPLYRADRRLSFSFRFGPGISWQSNIYNPDTNPGNQFFGSSIAFIAVAGVGVHYRIDDNLLFRITGNYNHISNGALVKPNYGINYPAVGVGIDYRVGGFRFERGERSDDVAVGGWQERIDLAFFFSGRKSERFEEWLPVYGVGGGYSRMIGRISALHGGVEIISDAEVKRVAREDFLSGVAVEQDGHLRIGLLGGHEFVIDRFLFGQYGGFYLWSPVKARHSWYQRYTLLTELSAGVSVGFSARLHGHVIDFLDMRLVRSF
jgi:hypothetical protein